MLRAVESEEPRGKNPHVPNDAPFVPLGNTPGTGVAFLDSHDALQIIIARDLSRNNLQRFFSAKPRWLISNFPRPRKGQNSEDAETFKPELAADMLTNACGFEGAWDPKNKLRGRGAWLGEDKDLVLHCGDRLWIDGRTAPAGRRGERVYPRGAPLMRPHKEPQGWMNGPGEQLLDLLLTWRWQRPDLDALLLLGWIGSAMVGGALKERPAVWLTGLKNSGKSTLVLLISGLFGNGTSILHSTNTTAAGVWQMLGYDSIPVLLDETEPSIDNRTLDRLLMMMRTSYTGGDVQRGSSEGTAHQYPVRSSFLFSSINVAPMKAQDRSRCAILEMQPLDPGARPLFNLSEMPMLGRALLRRMVDHWDRLQGDVLPEYRDALILRGWDGRGADTVGTLLACASVLRADQASATHDLEDVDGDLAAALEMQRGEEAPDWSHVINHLRGALADPWRAGERRPIGELVRQGAGYGVLRIGPQQVLDLDAPQLRTEAQATHAAGQDDALEAQRVLMSYGLKVMLGTDPQTGKPRRYVAVANQSAALQDLFRGTHWAGQSGTSGGWRAVLARAPGAEPSGAGVYFRDGKHRAVLVPLELFLGLDEGETVA